MAPRSPDTGQLFFRPAACHRRIETKLWHGINGKTVGETVGEHIWEHHVLMQIYSGNIRQIMGHTNRKPWSFLCGFPPMPLAPSQIPPEMLGILTIPKGRFMALRLIITLITIRSKIISGKSRMDIRYFFYYSRVPFRVSTWVPKRRWHNHKLNFQMIIFWITYIRFRFQVHGWNHFGTLIYIFLK